MVNAECLDEVHLPPDNPWSNPPLLHTYTYVVYKSFHTHSVYMRVYIHNKCVHAHFLHFPWICVASVHLLSTFKWDIIPYRCTLHVHVRIHIIINAQSPFQIISTLMTCVQTNLLLDKSDYTQCTCRLAQQYKSTRTTYLSFHEP